jgi:Ser/Thr protein kinase RdoA (MazF antagonist)
MKLLITLLFSISVAYAGNVYTGKGEASWDLLNGADLTVKQIKTQLTDAALEIALEDVEAQCDAKLGKLENGFFDLLFNDLDSQNVVCRKTNQIYSCQAEMTRFCECESTPEG